jgi:periplasmic divalent cation tolerance protein
MRVGSTINVITTVDKKEILEEIGRSLLNKRLITCIQIVGPIESIYWWNGQLEETEEWLGIMKTRGELYPEVEREIKSLHPYKVPEIAAVEADRVMAAYEKWVMTETKLQR